MSCHKVYYFHLEASSFFKPCTGNAAPCHATHYRPMRPRSCPNQVCGSSLIYSGSEQIQTRPKHASQESSVVVKIRFCMAGPILQHDNPSFTRDRRLAWPSNDQLHFGLTKSQDESWGSLDSGRGRGLDLMTDIWCLLVALRVGPGKHVHCPHPLPRPSWFGCRHLEACSSCLDLCCVRGLLLCAAHNRIAIPPPD